MTPESLTNSPALAALAITLIHFLWQGALVALVLKALLSLICYQKSQWRYALSSTAMLANLLLPVITFFMVYDIDYRQTASLVHALPLLKQPFYLAQIPPHAWYLSWLEYLPLLAIAWLTIVLTLAVKLMIELQQVNKLPLQGCSAANSALQSRFDELIIKIGLAKKITLLVTHKSHVPMAIGWLKPVVLLPFSMLSGLSPQQLDMLLLHELAHIRRHDYLVNFLQTLVEILLFFHPAVRWVSKQMRNEREYCSDDIAVQHCGSSLAYAHTLADTASLCQKHRHHSIPNMAMAASGGDLKQRVVRLIEQQQHCTKATDSGKWLAPFSILFVITMAFFQQTFTFPTIDLTSGSLSLFNPAKAPSRSEVQDPKVAFGQTQALANMPLIAQQRNGASNTRMLAPQQTLPLANELTIVNSTSAIEKNVVQHQAELRAQMLNSNNSVRSNANSNIELFVAPANSQKVNYRATNNPAQPLTHLVDTFENSPSKLTARLSHAHDSSHDLSYSSLPERTRITTAYTPAQLILSAEPRYPSSAKRKAIELDILVEFNIDESGLVTDIQFESKRKVNYFRNAIRSAMEK
ncbi:MAG: M56 family metallopeptidase [Cognaticolwellia sp.]